MKKITFGDIESWHNQGKLSDDEADKMRMEIIDVDNKYDCEEPEYDWTGASEGDR